MPGGGETSRFTETLVHHYALPEQLLSLLDQVCSCGVYPFACILACLTLLPTLSSTATHRPTLVRSDCSLVLLHQLRTSSASAHPSPKKVLHPAPA